MSHQVEAIDRGRTKTHVNLDSFPDICPRCHKSIHVAHLYATILGNGDYAQILFRCSSQSCDELFLANYKKQPVSRIYHLISTDPKNAKSEQFADTVSRVSPTFVHIYNQAMAAEAFKLDQLVGVGLRKGLEFLIKDFAVQQNPGNDDKIRVTQLGPCIDRYVTDVNIKECAKRAAWLGNDETHYTRKWEDKDIRDLKLLVKLTCNWIDNVLLTEHYMGQM